jgi:hypothetical protein
MTWYSDDDGDGRGLDGDRVLSCVAPAHYVPTGDDCDDTDPGAWLTPGEAGGLLVSRIADGASLDWESQAESAGFNTVYDVVTGDLGGLHSTGTFSGATCLASDLNIPSHADTRAPPDAGAGVYYLIRARNGCGNGTHGDSSIAADPRDLLDASGPCP